MNYEKAIEALNNPELEAILERTTTHIKRFNIVVDKFTEWRNKTSTAFVHCAQYLPKELRGPILDDLEATIYLYDDLAECLKLYGEDMTDLGMHAKNSNRDMKIALSERKE